MQIARLRENSIKALQLSAEGYLLSGEVSRAEVAINRAIEIEFEPRETELKLLEQLYTFNKDALERVDKKRADALAVTIADRNRILDKQKNDKSFIQDLGLKVGQFTQDSTKAQEIFNATNIQEAITKAAPYLQDPKAKQDFLNSQLEFKLKLSCTQFFQSINNS